MGVPEYPNAAGLHRQPGETPNVVLYGVYPRAPGRERSLLSSALGEEASRQPQRLAMTPQCVAAVEHAEAFKDSLCAERTAAAHTTAKKKKLCGLQAERAWSSAELLEQASFNRRRS